MTEAQLHKQICDYLHYKNVIFNTDMSGMKLTQGQAVKASKLRSSSGFPDIQILEPRIYGSGQIEFEDGQKNTIPVFHFCGLFIEVKKETPYKKDGNLKKNEHLEKQNEFHKVLRKKGYMVQFVWSLDQAKKIIDNYLNL